MCSSDLFFFCYNHHLLRGTSSHPLSRNDSVKNLTPRTRRTRRWGETKFSISKADASFGDELPKQDLYFPLRSSRTLREARKLSTAWIRLRACLRMRFGVKPNSDGVRPSSGAATWHCERHWRNREHLLVGHCCGRGRPHSERWLFRQALITPALLA